MTDYKIVKELEDELVIWYEGDDEVTSIPKNKFEHNECVKTTKNHYSRKDFTSVLSPHWNGSSWQYGEGYIDRNGSPGGSGWSWPENYFEKLSDPVDILLAKKISLKREIRDFEILTTRAKKELSEIENVLELLDTY